MFITSSKTGGYRNQTEKPTRKGLNNLFSFNPPLETQLFKPAGIESEEYK
jgi:hypothetical protein